MPLAELPGLFFFGCGAFLMLIGLLNLIAPDFMWAWHRFHKDIEGVRAERTQAWDTMRGCSGVVLMIAGIVMIVIGFAQ